MMQILRSQLVPFLHVNTRWSVKRLPLLSLKRFHTSHVIRGVAKSDFQRRLATEEADYQEAISLLNQYQRKGTPAKELPISGRQRTKAWLKLLKCDVENISSPKIIHVAGSKGKGTTCYYCNRLLNEYRTTRGEPKKIGCYTSPHPVEVRDRFMINDERIPKWLFSSYVQKLHDKIQWHIQRGCDTPAIPSYPGFLALLAIYIFVVEKFDVVVLETGIGGEEDSTNVFRRPVATGITSIGLDHVQVLGNTVEQIAWHKAGIFKPGSPAFAVEQDEAILDVFYKRAEERQVAGGLQVVTDHRVLAHGLKLTPDMHYQRLNAALAIALVESYLKSEDPRSSITDKLASSLQNTELPGRSQVIADHDNTWFISIAHSVISLIETIAWYKRAVQKPEPSSCRVLIFNHGFSIESPRDARPLLEALNKGLCIESPVPLQGVIFCTDQLDVTGKEKPDLIDFRIDVNILSSLRAQKDNAKIWKELGGSGNIDIVHTVREAVLLVREKYKGAEILVTGSSFLASGLIHVL